eukprot:tig00000269_g23710.t1
MHAGHRPRQRLRRRTRIQALVLLKLAFVCAVQSTWLLPVAAQDAEAPVQASYAAHGSSHGRGLPRSGRVLAAAPVVPDATSSLDCQPREVDVAASLSCTLTPRAAVSGSSVIISAPAASFMIYPPSGAPFNLSTLSVPASGESFVFSLSPGALSGPLSVAAAPMGGAWNVSVPVTVTAVPDETTTVEVNEGAALAAGTTAQATIVLRRRGSPAYARRAAIASVSASGALASASLAGGASGYTYTLTATVTAGPTSATGTLTLALTLASGSGAVVVSATQVVVYSTPDITSYADCPGEFAVVNGPLTCTIHARASATPIYALRSEFLKPAALADNTALVSIGELEGPVAARTFTATFLFLSSGFGSEENGFRFFLRDTRFIPISIRGSPLAIGDPNLYIVLVKDRIEEAAFECPSRDLFVGESSTCTLYPKSMLEAGNPPVVVPFGNNFNPLESNLDVLQFVGWPASGNQSSAFPIRIGAGSNPGNATLRLQVRGQLSKVLEQTVFVWSLPDNTSEVSCPLSTPVARGAPLSVSFEARSAGQALASVPWAFAESGFSRAESAGEMFFEPEETGTRFDAEARWVEDVPYPSDFFTFDLSTSSVPTGPARLAARLALSPQDSLLSSCPIFLYDIADNSSEISCPQSLVKASTMMNCSVVLRRLDEPVHGFFASLEGLTSTGTPVTIADWAPPADGAPRRSFPFGLFATDATGPAAIDVPASSGLLAPLSFPLVVYDDADETTTLDCAGAAFVVAATVNCTVQPRKAGRVVYSPSDSFTLELRPVDSGAGAGARRLHQAIVLPLPSGVANAFPVSFVAPDSGSYELRLGVGTGAGAGSVSGAAPVLLPVETQVVLAGLQFTVPALLGLPDPLRVSASLAAGTDTVYRWDFGDGATALGAEATHLYSANGTYVVALTVENSVSALRANRTVLVEAPIEGLALSSGSPVAWKAAAQLRASVTRGSNVEFTIRVLDAGRASPPYVFSAPSATFRWPDRGTYRVEVEARNAVYVKTITEPVSIEPFDLLALNPASIPSRGQESITILGRRFVDGYALRCLFDYENKFASARFLSSEAIACVVPGHPAGNMTITVAYDTEVPNPDDTLALAYTSCPPGQYQTSFLFACQPCDPGTYSPDGIIGKCPFCPDGTYQPSPGQSDCLSCPANAGTTAGASRADQCVCRPGYWGTAFLGDGCITCPDGTDCTRSNTTYPPAVPGRWISRLDATVSLFCDPPEACPGGIQQCEDGYSGFRCGECKLGHYRVNGECNACSGKEPPFIGIVAVLLALLFFYCIYSARSFSRVRAL